MSLRVWSSGLLRVEKQIQDDLLELLRVSVGRRQARLVLGNDGDAGESELRRAEHQRLLDDLRQVHRPAGGRALPREEKEALDDLGHAIALGHDELDRPADLGRRVAGEHELAMADHDGQGVVELVRHARDELAHRGELGRLDELGLGLLERAEPGARLLVQAGVVERQRRLVREGLEQGDVGGGEDAPHLIAHREGADDLAPHAQRHAEHGARLAARRVVPQPVAEDERGVLREVRRPHRPALQHRAPRHPRPGGQRIVRAHVVRSRPAPGERPERAIGVLESQPREGDAEQRADTVHDAAADVHHVEASGEAARDARQLLRLAPAAGGLDVEPRVVERERRLIGHRLGETHVVRREHAALVIAHRESADGGIPRHQRHGEDGAVGGLLDTRPHLGGQRDARVGEEVVR